MHTLIATDGSAVSIDAAKQAVSLLNPTKVTLLTVADTSIADDSGAGGFRRQPVVARRGGTGSSGDPR
ncbi:MAG: hypothetical protein M5U19_16565 [Microthrixaceae bacterium]|nr:hypothetical protein [Microthrixaceae bacterium]